MFLYQSDIITIYRQRQQAVNKMQVTNGPAFMGLFCPVFRASKY